MMEISSGGVIKIVVIVPHNSLYFTRIAMTYAYRGISSGKGWSCSNVIIICLYLSLLKDQVFIRVDHWLSLVFLETLVSYYIECIYKI